MSTSSITPETLPPARSRTWGVLATGIGLGLIAALFVASDVDSLLALARRIEPADLAWPVLCTVGSYAAMARSYQAIARAAGLDVSFREMARITLVSTVANYLISTGGLSGLAVRSYYFSRDHRLGWGSAVSISLAQTVITNVVLLAFVAWGAVSLLFRHRLTWGSVPLVSVLLLVLLALFGLVVAVVVSRNARLQVFSSLVAALNALSRRFVRRPAAWRARLALFEEELHEGIDFLLERRERMGAPILYITLDWMLMLATLYTAFTCLGVPVSLGVVIIGFSAGILLSVVNLIPGGLGLMEGSMAAAFAALGVPLEPAVLATLIFRLSYYVLPLVVTAILFPAMLRSARTVSLSETA